MIARILTALLLATALPAAAGLLSAQGVAVVDQTGAPRQTFSTNEKIGFTVAVNNGALSPNRTSFTFNVTAPNGNIVFRHFGNSVRGTVGTAVSSVAGIAISGFVQGPGTYTLKATASLDGVTLEQDSTFVISSPNILLIYPPNGSVNLTDNPLTFQWYSSGAATYRVTVGDSPSLYNALFIQTTAPGASSLTYPQNPSDARQRLSTGQVYYWNVAGLDGNGNVVAQSQMPFSFSVANTSLTRDIAVTGLTITGPADSSGNIPFLVTVTNQGNTTETNVPLRVTVGGLTAPGTPITVPQLSPADVKTFGVAAPIPTDMASGLVIACLTIFDDNVANNCMTMTVNRPPAISSSTLASQTAEMTPAQIWAAIEQILRDQGIDLSGYNLIGMEGSLTQAQMLALLDQLRQGLVQTSLSGPPLGTIDPTISPAITFSTTAAMGAAFGALGQSTATDAQNVSQEQVWTGLAEPLAVQTVSRLVSADDAWSVLWKRLSSENVPDIDFRQHSVIAIMAGSGEKGDRIEIEESKTEGDTLLVRYQIVATARPFDAADGGKAAAKKVTQYMLTVIPRTVLKVKFDRRKED